MKNILIFGLAISGIMFSSSVFAGDVTMKTTYWFRPKKAGDKIIEIN